MSQDRLKYLLEQYITETAIPSETEELLKTIAELKDDSLVKEKMFELWNSGHFGDKDPQTSWSTIAATLADAPVPIKKRLWFRLVAAVIIAVFSVVAYMLLYPKKKELIAETKPAIPSLKLVPGSDKALLTLANGEQIVLDSLNTGSFTQQGNTRIRKSAKGQLEYFPDGQTTDAVLYNIISTPRGGQYQVTLSDGSRVWLNATSSLKFPVLFYGNSREVQLEGEAYFEINADAEKPFIVSVNGASIRVTGTSFNVNAYKDETALKTTLLTGKVEISKGNSSKNMLPGQQAQIAQDDQQASPEINLQMADVDAVIAWKNGRFIFRGDNIQAVMRQLARWYDADISFDENVTREEFVGVINRSRYDDIFDILAMLEKTGTVSFDVKGNQIKVLPYKKNSGN